MDERKKQFFETVFANEESAKKYMPMSPEEVAEALKAEGLDYSVDEIKEYGAEVQQEMDKYQKDELNPDDLDNVSGGKGEFWTGVVVGAMIGVCCLGGW